MPNFGAVMTFMGPPWEEVTAQAPGGGSAGEGASADEIIENKGLKQVTDSGAIEAMLDEVLAANAEQVEQYRASDEAKRGKMFGFFVGQAMKASKGKANPGQVNQLLKKKLEG